MRRDDLQSLVLRTNRWFPFRYTNRWPYALALKSMVCLVSAHPQVRSLYLRHGLTSARWIPGLSDIDLSVIVESDLPPQREFDLIDSLRRDYDRLGKWFPMLGELEILSEDDLNPWLRATSEAPAPRAWTLLWGSPTFAAGADSSPRWRERALDIALWTYLDVLSPCLVESDSYLGRRKAWRRAQKIQRLLTPILAEMREQAPHLEANASVPLTVANAAKTLGAAISGQNCSVPATLVRARGRAILIVENGLTAEQMVKQAAGNADGEPAAPLPAHVFAYVVRRHDPFAWSSVASQVSLPGLLPPGQEEFAAWWLARFDHVLAFQRGPELFAATGSLDPGDLESELTRLMGIRLCIEKAWGHDRSETERQWRLRFPECDLQLRRILAACRDNARDARQQAFVLFRSLAAELREAFMARIGL